MNILIITTRLNLGGIGVYVNSLARGLIKKGHKVIVASSGGTLENPLKEAGIQHIHIPIDTSTEVGPHIMVSVMRLLKIVRSENIQIIHAQTRVSQIIGHYIEKFSGATFVTTCHGFFKRRLFRMLLPCWGNKVAAISDAVREHLINTMKVPMINVELIYNGIDANIMEDAFSKEDIDNARRDFKLSSYPIIGITARLSSVKGHMYLILAMPRIKQVFPDAQLLMVGSGKSKYETKLRAICKRLNIEKDVLFEPSTDNVPRALSVMDVFVLPSIQEGLGLSLLEALAMGLPVVASNVGGISSVIKHEKNGILVPPKDDKALADAVIRLLQDKEYVKKLAEKGRQTVKDKFTLDRMIENIEGFYAKALKK